MSIQGKVPESTPAVWGLQAQMLASGDWLPTIVCCGSPGAIAPIVDGVREARNGGRSLRVSWFLPSRQVGALPMTAHDAVFLLAGNKKPRKVLEN